MTSAKKTKATQTPPKPRKSRRIDPDKDQSGKGGGRPMVVFDKQKISEVERLSAMLTVEQMGDYFGLGQTTMFEIFKRQPEVSVAYRRGRAKIIGVLSQNCIQRAQNGCFQSLSLYMRTQAGWTDKLELAHSGSVGVTGIKVTFKAPNAS